MRRATILGHKLSWLIGQQICCLYGAHSVSVILCNRSFYFGVYVGLLIPVTDKIPRVDENTGNGIRG